MKKRGIINAQLAGLIAGLGHKDTFMIGDGGMPIPKGVEIVDLALCGGVPTFRQVMDAVLDEARSLRRIRNFCLISEKSFRKRRRK